MSKPLRHTILATLPGDQLLTTILSHHRFHIVQAINGGAHPRLIIHADGLGIRDWAPKIHLHLPLFLSDDSLNN